MWAREREMRAPVMDSVCGRGGDEGCGRTREGRGRLARARGANRALAREDRCMGALERKEPERAREIGGGGARIRARGG